MCLETKWIRLCKDMDAHCDVRGYYARLMERYAESHRAYHTSAHIAHCLLELEELRFLVVDPFAVEMAIWFHDAVYNPQRYDNEEASIKLFREFAEKARLKPYLVKEVARLISATRHQDASDKLSCNEELLLDIDLAILGQPDAVFDRYEEQIRTEYAWVPLEVYRKRRSEILEGFLRRSRIFRTSHFRKKYEQSARANIARSLAALHK